MAVFCLFLQSHAAGSRPLSPQVMYGGRAIDSFDRRILTIYMDEYLGDFLFDTFQPFHFFRNREVDYKIPAGDVKERFVGEVPQTREKYFKVFSEGVHAFQLFCFLWSAWRLFCPPA